MAEKTTLSHRQRRAIRSLLTYPTVAEAAEQAGVARGTVYKWLQDEAFRAALADAQAQALDGVLRELLTEATASIRALAAVRDDKSESGAVRANAAGKLLSLLPELRPPEAPDLDPAQVAREMLFTAQWAALRTVLLEALAPYPEARARLAEVLSGNDA